MIAIRRAPGALPVRLACCRRAAGVLLVCYCHAAAALLACSWRSPGVLLGIRARELWPKGQAFVSQHLQSAHSHWRLPWVHRRTPRRRTPPLSAHTPRRIPSSRRSSVTTPGRGAICSASRVSRSSVLREFHRACWIAVSQASDELGHTHVLSLNGGIAGFDYACSCFLAALSAWSCCVAVVVIACFVDGPMMVNVCERLAFN